MSDTEGQVRKQPDPQASGGMGLGDFSMTSVRATETEEASEVATRGWRTLAWLIVLILVAGTVVWWLRVGQNVLWKPEHSDKQFLLRLNELSAVKNGVFSDIRFTSRISLECRVAPSLTVKGDSRDPKILQNRDILRNAIKEVVTSFSNYRPNKPVTLKGYIGTATEPMFDARWRLETSASGDEKTAQDPVWMDIEGVDRDSGEESAPVTTGG
jgi:hypothetical protein